MGAVAGRDGAVADVDAFAERAAGTLPPGIYPSGAPTARMAYRTTVGWSLLSSGVVTLVLSALPGEDVWWGIALLVLGVLALSYRG